MKRLQNEEEKIWACFLTIACSLHHLTSGKIENKCFKYSEGSMKSIKIENLVV